MDAAQETPAEAEASRPFRVLPAVTPENEHFWRGGAEGELRFLRCQSMRLLDPPAAADLPDLPGRDARRRGGVGPGHGPHVHRQLAAVDPRTSTRRT